MHTTASTARTPRLPISHRQYTVTASVWPPAPLARWVTASVVRVPSADWATPVARRRHRIAILLPSRRHTLLIHALHRCAMLLTMALNQHSECRDERHVAG